MNKSASLGSSKSRCNCANLSRLFIYVSPLLTDYVHQRTDRSAVKVQTSLRQSLLVDRHSEPKTWLVVEPAHVNCWATELAFDCKKISNCRSSMSRCAAPQIFGSDECLESKSLLRVSCLIAEEQLRPHPEARGGRMVVYDVSFWPARWYLHLSAKSDPIVR